MLGVESTDDGEAGRLVSQVTNWCESLDEFGVLVWMAVTME